jgi:hypothetical protein
VQAEERGDQIGEAEDVKAAAEDGPGDAIERRTDPGDLRPVDGEVGRDGAVEALLDEDFVAFALGDRLACRGP